tara:strand:- start:550 stop:837 length:288 start_codon:yes stop_codon:yes gene_type:complete
MSEDRYRHELRQEVRQDLTAFRRMQRVLTRRLSALSIRRMNGETYSPLEEFAGTTAVQGALSLSITQMEYMLAALDAQLADDGGADVVPLPERES